MNNQETGQLIAKLRKEKGLTQKGLADSLYVTDKAVSKWERGVCLPDSSLLPKLSMILDADIEYLISGKSPYGEHKWSGEIRVDNIVGDIGGKPILHYLLSYLMLIGIKDICIKTSDKEYVKGLNLQRYGLNITFDNSKQDNVVIIYDKFLIFGNNLTRYFQSFLSLDNGIIPMLDGKDLPILFSHHANFSIPWHKEHCERKKLGRGMIFLPMNKDCDNFIKIYEYNSGLKIADLLEIAKLRGLV